MNQIKTTMKRIDYSVKNTSEGIKTISLYSPNLMAEIECFEGFYSNEEEIQNYLDDNGYEDETFEFFEMILKGDKRNETLIPVHIGTVRDENFYYVWNSVLEAWINIGLIPEKIKRMYAAVSQPSSKNKKRRK